MSDDDSVRRPPDQTPVDVQADQRLLEDLTAALGPADLPPGLLERAAGLLTWRDVTTDLDGELAVEVGEPGSAGAGAPEPAGARGGRPDRDVTTFELADGSLTVEVRRAAGGSLTGLLHAAEPVTRLLVERSDGPAVPVAVDDLGGFELPGQLSGPVRLRATTGDREVHTSWFLA